jgi:hypothetical protein
MSAISCPCCGLLQGEANAPAPSDAERIAGLERALENERTLLRGTIRRIEKHRESLDLLLHDLRDWHAKRRAIGTNR